MTRSTKPLPSAENSVVTSTSNAPPDLAAPRRRVALWLQVLAFSGVAAVVAGSGTAYGLYSTWEKSDRIAPGVVVQGVPLNGMTRAQARETLEKRFSRLFVEVQTPQRSFKVALKQLGGTPQINDAVNNAYWYGRSGNRVRNVWRTASGQSIEQRLTLPVKWDKTQMRRTMWNINTSFRTPPQDARLLVQNGVADVMPETSGRAINVGATLQNLQRKYYVGLPALEATLRETRPRVLAADLQGDDVKIGEYKTYFDSGLWGRTRNIHIAVEAIEGHVIMPGETFSFNGMTGERTWDKGYRMAHIFERKPGAEEAEVVDGLAGGVCQVSSTLFNAVRRTNNKTDGGLQIVERNSHSLPVTYVPTGLDATVAWPYKDFKFRNALQHPIYLRTEIVGSKLIIGVWGRVPYGTSVTYAATKRDDNAL